MHEENFLGSEGFALKNRISAKKNSMKGGKDEAWLVVKPLQ